MPVGDRLFAVHTLNVRWNEIHRARAEKGDHGDNVVQVLRLHLQNVAGHAVAFELEDTGGTALTDELEGFGIIRGNVMQVEFYIVAVADEVAGTLHDGKRGEAKEVHLEQAHLVHNVHLELGDRFDRGIF